MVMKAILLHFQATFNIGSAKVMTINLKHRSTERTSCTVISPKTLGQKMLRFTRNTKSARFINCVLNFTPIKIRFKINLIYWKKYGQNAKLLCVLETELSSLFVLHKGRCGHKSGARIVRCIYSGCDLYGARQWCKWFCWEQRILRSNKSGMFIASCWMQFF